MSTVIQNYFTQFDGEALLTALISKTISLVLLIIGFFILKKLIQFIVQKVISPSLKLTHDNNRQHTLTRLIENTLNYVLYFFLIYSILSILGLPVSSLLAGAGIAGVAIGLGAQGFLSDLVNGFFILLERQFDVGDSVTLTNGTIKLSGYVYSVGIRTTQIRDFDGTLHFIPNRNILVVSNLSRGDMRVQVDLPLAVTVNLEKVYQIIEGVNKELVAEMPVIKQAPTIFGPQLAANGQTVLRIHLFVENGKQFATHQAVYRRYQEALRAEGIEFIQQPYTWK
ncbi:mechanosensitive ion channel family protein [Streptococcus moroccensis]|uniref:Small conductance mechanosensitive channel n=1 Tax=Streptococcus moroccensis TaxID=1451356 RepID=A0ABT9YT73_9STRE|nr:mechanosensitive ion channel family protein [Streptococcus moroccensis]MDQ0222975.1 small conductance mechanosensitive channel [Streptococcus moroccensis]